MNCVNDYLWVFEGHSVGRCVDGECVDSWSSVDYIRSGEVVRGRCWFCCMSRKSGEPLEQVLLVWSCSTLSVGSRCATKLVASLSIRRT